MCNSTQGTDCSWSDALHCVATAVAQFNSSQLASSDALVQQMDASMWGDCSNAVAYKRMNSACGQMSDPPIIQTECEAYGAQCEWTTSGHCRTTAMSILTAAFNLSATHPAALAEAACLNATTNTTCAAIGSSFTLNLADLLGLKDGNFPSIIDTISDLLGVNISDLVDGNSTITNTTAHTGGAAAVSSGRLAAFSNVLLMALLL